MSWNYEWVSDWEWMTGYEWTNIEGKMAGYLAYKTPDYDANFPDIPISSYSEIVNIATRVIEDDSGDEERVTTSLPDFRVILNLPRLKKDQLETLIDFYTSETKAKGKLRSFKWSHPVDGCVYVVRFDSNLIDIIRHGFFTDELSITLRVLGVETFSF